jgi:HPt (histidine-containing phosphotransfer) domain-containing protein
MAQLREAVLAKDAPRVIQLAHAIKGSAANISAGGVSATAALLEHAARAGELASAPATLVQLDEQLTILFDTLEQTLATLA